MIAWILSLLSLIISFQDPPNDAFGDGSLRAPTSAAYRSVGVLDLTQFDLIEDPGLGFELHFASLGNPFELDNGFSLPIVEVYVQDEAAVGGAAELLPGSGMQLPEGERWHYAFQLSGDRIRVLRADGGDYQDVTGEADVSLSVVGNALRLETDLVSPDNLKVYGAVGNYAPFSETGWGQIADQASPWAYSSPAQRRPVVDLLAVSAESQQQAIQEGVLPAIRSNRVSPPNSWVYVMLAGVLLGLLGVLGRLFSRGQAPATTKPEPQLVTGIPAIDWDAPELNQNINDVVAGRAKRPIKRPAASPEAVPNAARTDVPSDTKSSSPEVPVPDVIDLRQEASRGEHIQAEVGKIEAVLEELETRERKPDAAPNPAKLARQNAFDPATFERDAEETDIGPKRTDVDELSSLGIRLREPDFSGLTPAEMPTSPPAENESAAGVAYSSFDLFGNGDSEDASVSEAANLSINAEAAAEAAVEEGETATGTADEAGEDEVKTVAFVAKHADKKPPEAPLQNTSEDEVKVYSLKDALKKFKPRDAELNDAPNDGDAGSPN